MNDARPSLTSTLVAAARGVGAHPEDPLARDLVPPRMAAFVRASEHVSSSLLRAASFGFVDHMTLRTRIIDDALRGAIENADVRQLVIVGAGLDARAHRIAELNDIVVFEVDRPEAQAYKRERLQGRPGLAKEIRYCPLDLERDTLEGALRDAGHRDDAVTFWIAEGLVPYLSMAAVRIFLGVVGERSSVGSRLALTYATPDISPLGGLFGLAALRMFEAIGEPLHGLMSPRQVRLELEAVAYRPFEDLGVREWASRYGMKDARHLYIDERYVLAERR